MIFLVVHVIRVDNRRALLVHPLVPAHVAAGLVGSSRVVMCARAARARNPARARLVYLIEK